MKTILDQEIERLHLKLKGLDLKANSLLQDYFIAEELYKSGISELNETRRLFYAMQKTMLCVKLREIYKETLIVSGLYLELIGAKKESIGGYA